MDFRVQLGKETTLNRLTAVIDTTTFKAFVALKIARAALLDVSNSVMFRMKDIKIKSAVSVKFPD